MITIKDVARKAGVSISTVSRVINNSAPVVEDKYNAVNQAMLELAYRPNSHAQALVRKCSNILGYLVSENLRTETLKTIESAAFSDNKHLVVGMISGNRPTARRRSIEKHLLGPCDAFILQDESLSDAEVVSLLRYHSSAVLLGRRISVLAGRCVYPDYIDAGYKVARYLIELGHRSIGFIGKNDGNTIGRLLQEGCLRALKDHNLSSGRLQVVYQQGTASGGYVAANEMFTINGSVTALIAVNDVMASGVVKAASESGKKIPRDVSLISCDDSGISHYLSPTLSAVVYPWSAMAESAVKLALASVRKKKYTTYSLPQHTCFKAKIKIYESVINPLMHD